MLTTRKLKLQACGGPRRCQKREVPLAVGVTERGPRKAQRLDWLLLLTTEGEATASDAVRCVRRYEARWTIEEFFRILKVGTRVEDHRLDDADDLRKCLAFDAITAWRVMSLERLARDHPEMFSAFEIDCLSSGLQYRRVVRGPPDMRTVITDIDRLVGFIPSRRQPLPGVQKVWEGWKRYRTGLAFIRAYSKHSTIKDMEPC